MASGVGRHLQCPSHVLQLAGVVNRLAEDELDNAESSRGAYGPRVQEFNADYGEKWFNHITRKCSVFTAKLIEG